MKRRAFLGALASATLVGTVGKIEASPIYKSLSAEPKRKKGKFDEDLIVFLTDVHLNPGEYQHDRAKKIVSDILSMKPLPANVIVLGDLAYLTGGIKEYTALKEVVKPIEDAGIQLTLAMGNHDRRENFAEIFPNHKAKSLLPDRYVYIVKTPKVDVIVLDSLQQGEDTTTWITPGQLSDSEISWLKSTLSAHSDKPVFVCSHHPISELKIQQLLLDNYCVKGYIYGHDHRWRRDFFTRNYSGSDLVQTLCLPSTGHWGDIGLTTMEITDETATAYLHQDDFYFPEPAKSPDSIPSQWKLMIEEHKGSKCCFALK